MDIVGLFESLANYLNFFIDFVMTRDIEQLKPSDSVNPILTSYFIGGVLVAFLIAYTRSFPDFASKMRSGKQSEKIKEPQDQEVELEKPMVASFVFISIVATIFIHFPLILTAFILGSEIGTIKDTLNASFAVSAIYNPIHAGLQHLSRLAEKMQVISRGFALFSSVIFFLIAFVYFGFLYYWIYALSEVHGTTRGFMIIPIAAMAFIGIAIAITINYFQGKVSRDVGSSVVVGGDVSLPNDQIHPSKKSHE